jgi:hypothetical protein
MTSQDQTLLEQAYNSIHESGVPGRSGAAASEYIRHRDQTPYTQDELGINTSHYKTVQPHMGKKQHDEDELSDAQTQEALAILNQYAQGDITAVEAAKMFEDLYKKGAGQGPQQDDLYRTKLK